MIRNSNVRRRVWLFVAVLGFLGLFAGTALAYYGGTASNTGSGLVGSLGAPTSPTATLASSNVTVGWGAAFLNNGTTFAQSYKVERYNGSGVDQGAACSGSTISSSSGTPTGAGSFTCTDSPGSGTFEYKISATYNSWTNTSTFTGTVTVSATPSKLAIVAQPSNTTAGVAISPAVTVQVEDGSGNPVADNNFSITLSPSSGAIASGAVASTNSSGLATFSAVKINTAATGLTLTAAPTNTGTGISTSAASNSFNVTAAGATQLAFTPATPGPGTAGSSIPSVAVSVEDTFGNVVTGQNTGSVGISIKTGSPQSSFTSGTTTKTVASGVASFTNLIVNTSGTYTLTATPSSISGVTTAVNSNSFTVNAATATKLVLGLANSNPTAGATANLTITAQDTFGNTATSYTGTKSITFGGAANSPNGNHPTVTNNVQPTPVAVNFGTAENITFASGVASTTTSGATGQLGMVVYKASATASNITVSDGSIGNGTGVAVTVDSAGVTLSLSPNPGPVAKNSTNTFTVLVPTDAYGNAFTSLNGIVVNLTITNTSNWGLGTAGTATKSLTITSGPGGNTVSVVESGANKTATLSGTTSASGFTSPSDDALSSGN
jgi:hypothetical protein